MGCRIRQAESGDALHVAAIVDMGGHGIEFGRWMECLDGDHSVLSAARRLVIEERALAYHYSKAHVVDLDGRVAGGMIGGLVTEEPGLPEPPYIEPLVKLENRLLGYWNILAIAVYPEFRGQGLASKL